MRDILIDPENEKELKKLSDQFIELKNMEKQIKKATDYSGISICLLFCLMLFIAENAIGIKDSTEKTTIDIINIIIAAAVFVLSIKTMIKCSLALNNYGFECILRQLSYFKEIFEIKEAKALESEKRR